MRLIGDRIASHTSHQVVSLFQEWEDDLATRIVGIGDEIGFALHGPDGPEKEEGKLVEEALLSWLGRRGILDSFANPAGQGDRRDMPFGPRTRSPMAWKECPKMNSAFELLPDS